MKCLDELGNFSLLLPNTRIPILQFIITDENINHKGVEKGFFAYTTNFFDASVKVINRNVILTSVQSTTSSL